jgi:flagellar biosynthesis GTPase FlhF
MSAMAERRAYRGETLEDALRQVREELGPEALVVRQREGVIGGIGGFFGRRCVELEVEAPAAPAAESDLWAEDTWVEPIRKTPSPLPARSVIDLYDSGDVPEKPQASSATLPQPSAYAHPASPSGSLLSPLDRYLAAEEHVDLDDEPEPVLETESPLVRTLFEQASPFADELAQAFERVDLESLPSVSLEPIESDLVAAEPVVAEPVVAEPVVAEPAVLALVEPEPAGAELEVIEPQAIAVSEPEPAPLPAVIPIFDPDGMVRRLVGAGLDARIARDVVAEAASELRLFDPTTPFHRQVQTVLARRIRTCRMSKRRGRRTIALVGPAGSGKTLTAARLCYAYGAQRSVAALSLEPVREAFELAQHTKDLDVAFAVAHDASTLQIELDKLGSSDVLVIDTPAIDLQDEHRLGVLALLLELIGPDETHLLMPASLGAIGVRELLEGASPALGVDRVLVTHCDGPRRTSTAIAAAINAKLPISFTATGKPWGLRPADAYDLAGAVVQ